MEKKESQQESKASFLLKYTEEMCKKHGFKCTTRKPNKEVFTVSFKKKETHIS